MAGRRPGPPQSRGRTTVWVILPAFNEEANLPQLIDGLAETLQAAGIDYRIVVVDDGSEDGTRSAAAAYIGRLPVHLIIHMNNRGLARTLETGFRWTLSRCARHDVIVTMDADNTHPPSLLATMVARIRGGSDLVIASRYERGGTEDGVSLLRRILSRGIAALLRLRFRMRGVRDYTSGYRAYRARLLLTASAIYGPHLFEARGFAVTAELLVRLQPFHPAITEVPLQLRYGLKIGRSKMRVVRTIGEYFRLLCSPPSRVWGPEAARAGSADESGLYPALDAHPAAGDERLPAVKRGDQKRISGSRLPG